jgi:dTDP-4-amino-4,6-dideoxygalactose transaminase
VIPIANPELGEPETERVSAVIESGMLADGDEVREFEQEFAEFCGVKRGVATSNGTTALHAALEALEIGDGDRVLTTPFSFIATANAIRHTGAEPVFGDIDPATYNLDPAVARETARTEDVDAILVVHLYGCPAEMGAFVDLASDLKVPLVEDCAQAHGAAYRGDRIGSFGDIACFSFYPTKNMTTGEGGIVLTDRPEVADRAERFADHGRTDDGTHATVGHNFRMTNLAAAMGRAQLERLPTFLERRRENAARLTDGLSGTEPSLPTEPEHVRHAYHQYTVRTADRRGLRDHLAAHDIGASVYYPDCIHEEPAYDDVTHDAPKAERAAAEVLSLPVHPNVSPDDIDRITEVITDYAV